MSHGDMANPEILDVLGRVTTATPEAYDLSAFAGRRVLVTGAGGSIGSAFCRAVARHAGAERLVMLDRDDTALHALSLSTEADADRTSLVWRLGDICDEQRLADLFAAERPEVVLHAAALKHVPLLQSNPLEAYRVNVLGTRSLLAAAMAAEVDTLVNVSTDKSSNPTTALGRTKRLGERLTAHAAMTTGRRYVSIRMGNVLGSRGSFLPRFIDQIESGEPVTVTHEDATRFLMTYDDVVALVAHATVHGQSGETLVADMGRPVRILDVALALMDGSGRRTSIKITGLRPGDKLHEDVFDASELPFRYTEGGEVSAVRVTPVDPACLDLQVFLQSMGLPQTSTTAGIA